MGEPPKTERIPAVIFASREAGIKIAALTVLDRLVVAIHRAGAGPITIITEEALPELKRSKALGILVTAVNTVPRVEGRMLVAEGNVLVQAADVRRCLAASGRLLGRDGTLLPIGVGEIRDSTGVERALAGVARVEAEGVARLVPDERMAGIAEKELWASMTSSADGLVDKVFNRPVGRWLSKALIFTPVPPNVVSVLSIFIGVISALFFAEGSYQSLVLGGMLFQLSAIVDCVDGDIARILFKESPIGKWIDFAGDQIVHISVFAGIAFGILRNGGGHEAILLGLSAIVGALISCVVVLRGMRRAAAGGMLQKLIDAATNRDFSVLVLGLAFFNQLPIFLWLAGIGSHLFWIAALGLQLGSSRIKAAGPR